MQTRPEETIRFLKGFHPRDWWILSAIPVEGEPGSKPVLTETFDSRDTDGVRKWLANHGKNSNLYFHPAVTRDPMNKKVHRKDIESVPWLHVDVDPRAGEDLEEEKIRIRALLDNPPGDLPKPTIILFSGGGYQAFWKLSEPIPVDRLVDKANDAGRYNLQIERMFEADACHSVDHLMRLPGTINRPDERKRKKGRVEALAEIVHWDEEAIYNIDQFTKAVEVQVSSGSGFTGHRQVVEIGGNIPRLSDVDELPAGVPDTVKAAIVSGEHPTDPEKHTSRSEVLWWVVCELTRAGVEPDIIYSVITDPSFEISSSVLDKKWGAAQYAQRQINQAAENAIHPALREMNERYAAVENYGGFSIVFEEHDPSLDRIVLNRIKAADLKGFYQNRKVDLGKDEDGNTKFAPLGAWWLSHPNRRQYRGVIFAPGKDVPEYYNLWQGFAMPAIPGTKHEGFLEHIKTNLCDNNEDWYAYMLGWMARAVQKPGDVGYSAVVLRGKRGTGKSFVAKNFGKLFGRHYVPVTDAKHLVGNFNAHLRDVVVVFADEAFYAGDKKHESVLKTTITEETKLFESKGVDVGIGVNCIHLIMASNESWVVPAGYDERRFFVLDVAEAKAQDTDYFGQIQNDLETGGYESLLHFLMTYDISDFNVRIVPKTDALREQIIESMNPDIDWWFQKLISGRVLEEDGDWLTSIWKVQFYHDYIESLRLSGRSRRATETQFGRVLSSVIPDIKQRRSRDTKTLDVGGGKQKDYDRVTYVDIPKLDECRAFFDKNYGGPFKWDELSKETVDPEKTGTDDDGFPF